MKAILERFEKLSAAHGLTTEAAAAMRGLLQAAHDAGFVKHMVVAEAADANKDEQDSLPGAADDDEPDDDEKEEAALARMAKAVRKEVRKSLKKEVRKALRKAVVRSAAR